MRIVPQSASGSYCPLLPMLALPAPAPIAGLLPACVPSSIPLIAVFKPRRESALDRQRAIWAAQDAELAEFLSGARQRLSTALAKSPYSPDIRFAHSVALEVCCAP